MSPTEVEEYLYGILGLSSTTIRARYFVKGGRSSLVGCRHSAFDYVSRVPSPRCSTNSTQNCIQTSFENLKSCMRHAACQNARRALFVAVETQLSYNGIFILSDFVSRPENKRKRDKPSFSERLPPSSSCSTTTLLSLQQVSIANTSTSRFV